MYRQPFLSMKNFILTVSLGIGFTLSSFAAPGLAAQVTQEQARERFEQLVERLDSRIDYDATLASEVELHLRSYPDLMADIPALIRPAGSSLDTARSLIFALECVGTHDAQVALVQIQGDAGQHQMNRVRSVISLGALAHPSELSIETLWTRADLRVDPTSLELSNAALLGLGITGNRLRHQRPEEYPAIRDGLLARLHGAPAAPERVIGLKAIGNLHDPALAEDASLYLVDEQATVRATAAQSIAQSRGEHKRDLLVSLLPRESRGIVRSAFVEALRGLSASQSSLSMVSSMVRTERHTEARAQMVEYLVEHLDASPSIRGVLVELASKDPNNRIRILASAALR